MKRSYKKKYPISERNKMRYKLHRKVRKEGFLLNTSKRTISVDFDTVINSESVKYLIDRYGYSVQFSIPVPDQNN